MFVNGWASTFASSCRFASTASPACASSAWWSAKSHRPHPTTTASASAATVRITASVARMAPPAEVAIRFATTDDSATILAFIRDLAEYEKLPDEVVADEAGASQTLFGARPAAEVSSPSSPARRPASRCSSRTTRRSSASRASTSRTCSCARRARGRGVGRALMAALARIAVQRDYGRFEWSVLDWNEPALGFYRSLGAKPHAGWTVQRLTGAPLAELAGHWPTPSSAVSRPAAARRRQRVGHRRVRDQIVARQHVDARHAEPPAEPQHRRDRADPGRLGTSQECDVEVRGRGARDGARLGERQEVRRGVGERHQRRAADRATRAQQVRAKRHLERDVVRAERDDCRELPPARKAGVHQGLDLGDRHPGHRAQSRTRAALTAARP